MKILLFTCFLGLMGVNEPEEAQMSNILFYIQRNLNQNIVVYEANFDANGQLNSQHPITPYWIMLEEHGKHEALNFVEKKKAYGVKCIPLETDTLQYEVQLAADKSCLFNLKQVAPYKALITAVIDDHIVELTRMFIKADNTYIWPKVEYILMEGTDIVTKQMMKKKIKY